MFSPQALAFSVAFIIRALADCKCGYTINAGKPTLDNPLFTDHISTDFTTSTDVTFESEPGKSWQVQAYNATAAQSNNAPYGRTAQLKNVVLNTLPPGYISSEGVHGGDPGLQLWVRSQLVQNGSESYVPIAEVVTARNDILYGSFRASMKTTGVKGTCGAFFFYHNDSQEIDVEILSKDQLEPNASHPVNLILQSPAAVRAGNDAANTSTFYLYGMLPAPDQMYIEYRWDWLPDRVDFYIQERLIHTMRDSVPQAPGTVHLIHWSTGNENWSAGPPVEDAVMTVAYVHAYFNTSNPTSTSNCDGTCQIPVVNVTQPDQPPPNPMGSAKPSEGPKCRSWSEWLIFFASAASFLFL